MKHIQHIDQFISSFLDQGEAMEIPLEGDDPADKTVGKVGTKGDPGIKRLVQSMSSEQKEELIANLLRHRAQHLGIMFGQMNGVLDEQGQPILPSPPAGPPSQADQMQPDPTGQIDQLMTMMR